MSGLPVAAAVTTDKEAAAAGAADAGGTSETSPVFVCIEIGAYTASPAAGAIGAGGTIEVLGGRDGSAAATTSAGATVNPATCVTVTPASYGAGLSAVERQTT